MSNRVVVITGGSSGIGATLAKQLAARGEQLVLAARDSDQLAVVAEQCGNRSVVCVPTDVTRRADVERLRDKAIATFGHVDVWVNNAGRGISRDVLDLTDDDLDQMFLVNTKSALYGMQAIVPYFKSRGEGHVINISTVLSRVPAATLRAAYSASKAALNVLTSNLRLDLRDTHPRIHVTLVLPGGVPTNFQKNAIGGTPGGGPVGAAPPQTAEEVAGVIAGVIENPVREVYTSALLEGLARQYCEDVDAFERSRSNQPAR